ncbi:glycoside hydrolase family 3 protein [Sphaerobolus stellatus SS14]|uniref:Glycoside hydrolase family 3 protein n=1 Tax=Sphaerobolus stellatus (strain SS14) TaxID=990650 RepID=A0A0C9V7L7_SPHS4|nr:glycoside hydrolase family 3 protein [Sphaerobolus stellatus SS14]
MLEESLRREIGQHFVVGFVGQDVTDEITTLIRDYYVGSIIIMKRNLRDAKHLRKLISDLQKVAKDAGHEYPLLMGIDQENGLVTAFSRDGPFGGAQFPGAMAIAATGDPGLAELVNTVTGREMKLAGLNWDYSPVCDINSDPRNPVIGVRSFGDDPTKVSQFAAAVAAGLTYAGIAPSPKHFPGHGDTHVDSHLGLPRIMKTLEQLHVTELVPFKHLVENKVPTIMTGHMALPLITGDDTPSSLSRKITTDLLRDELGYEGVIVTDCLEMDAVVEAYGTENGAVEALKAGADIAMICHRFDRQRGAVEASYEAVEKGIVLMDALKVSGKRILEFKKRFVEPWETAVNPHLDEGAFLELKRLGAAVQRDSYSKSIAVISDQDTVIPLRPSENDTVLVFIPQLESLNRAVDDAENIIRTADGKLRNTVGPSYMAFADSISKRVSGRSKSIVYGPKDSVPSEDIHNANSIIFATRNGDKSTWQMDYLKQVLDITEGKPVVILATLTPYEVLTPITGHSKAAYMCSFEYTALALETSAATIFGEIKAHGHSPVRKQG